MTIRFIIATLLLSPLSGQAAWLDGHWGWTIDNGYDCETNPHWFEFAVDKSSFAIVNETPIESASGELTTRSVYRILDVRGDVIEAALEGESRRTEAGDLVVWNLVILRELDRYCWQRTDWPEDACTAHVERCW